MAKPSAGAERVDPAAWLHDAIATGQRLEGTLKGAALGIGADRRREVRTPGGSVLGQVADYRLSHLRVCGYRHRRGAARFDARPCQALVDPPLARNSEVRRHV